jgi:hypothetical protein
MMMTLEQLRNLMRSKAKIDQVDGKIPEVAVVKSRFSESKHKRRKGSCWAYVCRCADLKGRVATCVDSGDPRCANG